MRHLLDEQLDNYANRKMSVKEMIEADAHLAACDECRNRLKDSSLKSLPSLINSYREFAKAKIQHLTFEELSGYVNRKLDPVQREIVESHMANCRSCTKELKDLQAFALTLNEGPEEETKRGFLQSILAAFGFSPDEKPSKKIVFGLPQLLGAMGALIVLFGSATLFILYTVSLNRSSHNSNTIASNTRQNGNSNKTNPTPSPTILPQPNNKNQNQEPKPVSTPRKASEGKIEEPQSAIATFILMPNIARDGEGKKNGN